MSNTSEVSCLKFLNYSIIIIYKILKFQRITLYFMTDYEDSNVSMHAENSPGTTPVCLSMQPEEFKSNAKDIMQKQKSPHTMENNADSSNTLKQLCRKEPKNLIFDFVHISYCGLILFMLLALNLIICHLPNLANIQMTETNTSQTLKLSILSQHIPYLDDTWSTERKQTIKICSDTEIPSRSSRPCTVSQDVIFLIEHTWPTDRKLTIRNRSDIEELQSYKNKSGVSHLDLSYNSISFLNLSLFYDFFFLSHLNLSKNTMQRAVGLHCVLSLRFVDMSSNNITRLYDLQPLLISYITVLSLSRNHISSLYPTDFLNYPYLKYLDITNNPIKEVGIISTLSCCETPFFNYTYTYGQYKSFYIRIDRTLLPATTNYQIIPVQPVDTILRRIIFRETPVTPARTVKSPSTPSSLSQSRTPLKRSYTP